MHDSNPHFLFSQNCVALDEKKKFRLHKTSQDLYHFVAYLMLCYVALMLCSLCICIVVYQYIGGLHSDSYKSAGVRSFTHHALNIVELNFSRKQYENQRSNRQQTHENLCLQCHHIQPDQMLQLWMLDQRQQLEKERPNYELKTQKPNNHPLETVLVYDHCIKIK